MLILVTNGFFPSWLSVFSFSTFYLVQYQGLISPFTFKMRRQREIIPSCWPN
ncbi:hypothetical protein JHK87_013793 [Glycine soja]|nr:hypothetical protein JHK87_013793 [Glycine soja]